MPTYEYRCDQCAHLTTVTKPLNEHHTIRPTFMADCPVCRHLTTFKRRFSFTFQPPMAEHFNTTVNKPISSMRQFRDELKRASAEATERTGIEHDYQPVEWGDTEALGVTNEGIDESNINRSRNGDPLLPEIKG